MMIAMMKEEKIEDRGWRIAQRQGAARESRAILYLLSSILFLAPAGCTVVGVLAHKVVGNPAVGGGGAAPPAAHRPGGGV
jgi:hypothetical protein